MEINRREFVGGLVASAATGCVSTRELPPVADDIFPKRGRYERLSLGYARVPAGATRPFSILHISDTHLTAAYAHEDEIKQQLRQERTQTFGGHQEAALRDSLEWAKSNVDYVLHTGDLIDWQSEANYDLVRKYYGPSMFGSMGNHEFSPNQNRDGKDRPTAAHRQLSRAALAAAYPIDLSFSSKVVNGVNFITLDDVYGTVNAEQVKRFADEVAKGLPIVLAMHVPFFTDFIWQAQKKFWFKGRVSGRKFTDAAIPPPAGDYERQLSDPVTCEFIAYLRQEPLLKAILAGHLHIDIQDRFSSTAMEYVVGGNFLFRGQEVLFT